MALHLYGRRMVRSRRLRCTAGAVLATVLVAAAGCSGRSADPPAGDPPATPSASPTVEPAVHPDVVRVPVRGYPIGLAEARDGGVWAVATYAGRVRHLTPGTAPAVDRSLPAGDTPLRAVDTPEGLWVSAFGADVVRRVAVGPEQDPVATRLPEPEGLAVDGDLVWVVDQLDGEVVALDRATGRVVRRVDAGLGPRLVSVGPSGVVVAAYSGDAVTLVPREGRPRSRRACLGPQGVVEQAGRIWVACTGDGSVVALDPDSLRRELRVPDLLFVDAVAAAPGRDVLVLLQEGPTVVRLDGRTGEETARAVLGESPGLGDGNVDLLVHDGRVWASSPSTDEVLVLDLDALPGAVE